MSGIINASSKYLNQAGNDMKRYQHCTTVGACWFTQGDTHTTTQPARDMR
jgi:hypothetical protein